MPRQRKPAHLFQRKDDGAWVILDGGKQIRTGFGDGFLEQAEAVLNRDIAQMRNRETAMVSLDQISLGEILVRYAEDRQHIVKDPERICNALKALSPFWANKTALEVTDDTCREYVAHRGVLDSTVRRELTTLNAALNQAAKKRRIPYAPTVLLPPKGVAKDRWLTPEEVDRLLKHSAPHIQRFIKIALATGRRKTAITQLKWIPSLYNGWVDMDWGVIHFLGKAEEESRKRKGIVRMPDSLRQEMATWDRDEPNVISFKGQPIKRIDQAFRRAARNAGFDDVTPHTLKHTAVTWAFMKGMTLEMATDFFATSRETLEEVYRSYHPDTQREAAAIMDRAFGRQGS